MPGLTESAPDRPVIATINSGRSNREKRDADDPLRVLVFLWQRM